MKTFAYRIENGEAVHSGVYRDGKSPFFYIDVLGREGWELVSVTEIESTTWPTYYFKKELKPQSHE